jgi:hypothetical protein
MISVSISQCILQFLIPFQAGGLVDFDPVPWWLPGTIVVVGLFLYGIPQVDRFITSRFREWQHLPRLFRHPVVGFLVGGAGLIVFSQLAQFDWMYVLFLFGYARAVEGATILHLFGRLDDAMRKVFDESSISSGSKIQQVVSWAIRRMVKRIPLLIVTTLLSALSVGLLVAVLIGFPDTPLGVQLAFVVTVATFALSTVNSAWVFAKITDEVGPGAFIGLLCCTVGGELYNVPAALSLFSEVSAVDGPFGAWTTVAVGTVGWGVGLILAVTFFYRRIRQRGPN